MYNKEIVLQQPHSNEIRYITSWEVFKLSCEYVDISIRTLKLKERFHALDNESQRQLACLWFDFCNLATRNPRFATGLQETLLGLFADIETLGPQETANWIALFDVLNALKTYEGGTVA